MDFSNYSNADSKKALELLKHLSEIDIADELRNYEEENTRPTDPSDALKPSQNQKIQITGEAKVREKETTISLKGDDTLKPETNDFGGARAKDTTSSHDEHPADLTNNNLKQTMSSKAEEELFKEDSSGLPPEVNYLRGLGIRCIDFRPRGGSLWAYGGLEIASHLDLLRQFGMYFTYSAPSSEDQDDEPSWWTSEPPLEESESIRTSLKLENNNRATMGVGSDSQEKAERDNPPDEETDLPSPELIGILVGISCDGRVNDSEARSLQQWLSQIDTSNNKHLESVKNLIERCLEDDVITPEEEVEMLTLFKRIISLVGSPFEIDVNKPLASDDQTEQETDRRKPTNKKDASLADYIERVCICEDCGAKLKLIRSGRNKFFLGCSKCDFTRLLTVPEIDSHIETNSAKCPECGGSIQGRVSRFGIYVRCENGHNMDVGSI